MFKYTLSVSLADASSSITDPAISDLLKKAVTLVNQSKNSRVKGRRFELTEEPIDEKHVKIILKSNTEVIPTRALSSLSRALLIVDKNGIITPYKKCILQSVLLEESTEEVTNLSDLEMTQTILSMVFAQEQIKSNREKELARKYVDMIRNLVMEYLSQRMP